MELTPQPILWPGEGALRNRLLAYQKKYGDASKNYGNLTNEEQKALQYLEQYLSGGQSEVMGAGEGEILRTLSGGYDPESSAYYQPLRAGIEQQRELTRDRTRRNMNLGGNLSSLARVRAEQEGDISYDAQIADMMMGLQERERERKMGMVPYAFNYGGYAEESPLRKAQAASSINPARTLEAGAIGLGQNILTGYSPSYYFPTYTANARSGGGGGLTGYGGAVAQGLGTILKGFFG